MRHFHVLAAASAALALALASAAPAQAAPREFFGVVPQQSLPVSDIERMAQGKVGTVRLQLFWPNVETTDDSFDWSAYDELIGNLAAEGIRPFPFLLGVPDFVSADALRLPVGSAGDKAQWEEFVTEALERYGPGGEYWENPSLYPSQHPGEDPKPVKSVQPWNEENAPKHTHPQPSVPDYGELVKITHSAATAVDPDVEIVLGGMFGRPTGGGAIDAWKFLKRLYGVSGIRGAFDSVALHPYAPGLKGIEDQFERIREVLKKKGDRQVRTWVTEIGWGSSGQSSSRLVKGVSGQAKLLKQSFKLFLEQRGKWKIAGVQWFAWRDLGAADAPCDWCASAGLFEKTGFDFKPAWQRFTKLTGGKP